MSLEPEVRAEIEALHVFFVDWFTGKADNADAVFAARFDARFDPEFILIPPAGKLTPLPALREAIKRGHGSNPAFEIDIRNATVRLVQDDLIIATYEEWQRNAKASQPPDNGRIATVIFRREADHLRWLHVHETKI